MPSARFRAYYPRFGNSISKPPDWLAPEVGQGLDLSMLPVCLVEAWVPDAANAIHSAVVDAGWQPIDAFSDEFPSADAKIVLLSQFSLSLSRTLDFFAEQQLRVLQEDDTLVFREPSLPAMPDLSLPLGGIRLSRHDLDSLVASVPVLDVKGRDLSWRDRVTSFLRKRSTSRKWSDKRFQDSADADTRRTRASTQVSRSGNWGDSHSVEKSFAFLSYARADYDYAGQLAGWMRDSGLNVWLDDDVRFGSDWLKELERRLSECRALVVLMSPDSDQSEYVRSEVLFCRQRKIPIFPVLLNGQSFVDLLAVQNVDVRAGGLPPAEWLRDVARSLDR